MLAHITIIEAPLFITALAIGVAAGIAYVAYVRRIFK